MEPGETPGVAATREAREELGLTVRVGARVAVCEMAAGAQHFFLATPAGGAFGRGDGAEMNGAAPPERGSYRPVWVPLVALPDLVLRPAAVARLVLAARDGGWSWP